MTPISEGPGISLEGRSVLVTGHSGFTGGWACRWLTRLGATVTGISLKPTSYPNLFEELQVSSFVNSHFVDICDIGCVAEIFHSSQPEFVLHLAAQPLVGESYADPVETYRSNVLGTVSILDQCVRLKSVQAVLCVTTDKVYENREWIWPYRESDVLGGKDPYSASKACCELAIKSYRESVVSHRGRSLRIDSARGGNIVGGGDWSPGRIIPDFVRSMTQGEALELRCPGATRPWQHVLSLVSGYLHIADRAFDPKHGEERGEAWNFGPVGKSHSVREVVETMSKYWKKPNIVFGDIPFEEAGLLSVDVQKAMTVLKWNPGLTFDEICEFTSEWYRDFSKGGEGAGSVTDSQIDRFVRCLATLDASQW